MKLIVRQIYLWTVALSLCCASALYAQDRSGKTREQPVEDPPQETIAPPATEEVVTAAGAVDLRVEEQVVETVAAGQQMAVEQTSGDWLWVRSAAGNHGWVRREEVLSGEQQAAPVDDGRLAAIGGLSASHVQMLYAYIGVVANGLGNEFYTPETTRDLMNEMIGQINRLIPLLRKVQQGGVDEADVQYFENLIELYQLLRQEAQSLVAVTESRSQANLDGFTKARDAVMPKMKSTFNLQ